MGNLHNYREILDLPDLPVLSNEELKLVTLSDPWSDLSMAWLGGRGFCRVRYRGKEYRNETRNRNHD